MSVDKDKNDMQIVNMILNGNRQMFCVLIKPYEQSVYKISLSFMKDEAEARDVVQETLMRAYRGLKAFRGESKFSTWLTSIAINEARGRLRKRRSYRLESIETLDAGVGARHISLMSNQMGLPSVGVELRELSFVLNKAIRDLPIIYREVFVLRGIEELNVRDVALALDISIAAVKVRYYRAKKMLQTRLAIYSPVKTNRFNCNS